ncbi:hypothetical protein [Bradyrhizobium brasilense]|uniref:Uncharacterized protein n=1 Tax=Bradyrhizobium brasilense TaxID=1419277 RepID=A0ABY8JKG6_9BRAD|nr:hypothetical protein [Bradyrhizobium brasilense]WFU64845.1 hypothetical protein QA636_04655 [Bradyrhizobium brasilense]
MFEPLTPIRTDVPIDMHPDAFPSEMHNTMKQEGTLGPFAFSAAREALTLCYERLAQLNDAQKAIHHRLTVAEAKKARRRGEDVRMVNGAQVIFDDVDDHLIEAARHALSDITPSVDRKMKELKGLHETLGKRVAEALDNPSRKTAEGTALAAEVRAYVKSLPDGERITFCMQAITDGDKATVAAILHAQPFLSGLTGDAQDAIRKQAAAKFAAVDSAQYDATTKLIERVMYAGNHLTARYSEVVNRPESRRAVAAKKVRALAGK